MEEVLKASLGIYRAGFYFVANLIKDAIIVEFLIISLVGLIVGWFTYKPRNGGEFGGRLLWYMFSGCYACILVFSDPVLGIYAWYFFIGVMLKFSFEILFNNATP